MAEGHSTTVADRAARIAEAEYMAQYQSIPEVEQQEVLKNKYSGREQDQPLHLEIGVNKPPPPPGMGNCESLQITAIGMNEWKNGTTRMFVDKMFYTSEDLSDCWEGWNYRYANQFTPENSCYTFDELKNSMKEFDYVDNQRIRNEHKKLADVLPNYEQIHPENPSNMEQQVVDQTSSTWSSGVIRALSCNYILEPKPSGDADNDVSRKDSGAPKSPEEDDIPYCMEQHFDENVYYRNKSGTDVSLNDFVQCANEEEAYFKKTTDCHDIDDYCSRIWCDNKEKYPAEFRRHVDNDDGCNPNQYKDGKSYINLFAPMSCVMTVNVETVNGVSKFHMLDKDPYAQSCRMVPPGTIKKIEDIQKFGKKLQAIDSWYNLYSAPGPSHKGRKGASTLRGGFANESAHVSEGYPHFYVKSSFVEVDNNANPITPRLKLDINEFCSINWICYTWENRKKLMDKTSLNPSNVSDKFSYSTVNGAQISKGILGFPIESYGWVDMYRMERGVDIPLNVEGNGTIVLSSNTTWKGDYQVCIYLKDSSFNENGPIFINFKV